MENNKLKGFVLFSFIVCLFLSITSEAAQTQELIITREKQVNIIKGDTAAPDLNPVEPGRQYRANQVTIKNELQKTVNVTLNYDFINMEEIKPYVIGYLNEGKINDQKGKSFTLNANESKTMDLFLAFEGLPIKNDNQEKEWEIEWVFKVEGSRSQENEKILPKTSEKINRIERYALIFIVILLLVILKIKFGRAYDDTVG
ncbi:MULTISPECIES: hypothetical protein [Vagococcus]|uniref:Cell surface protein n=1 Tax=Vagococcus fluvialis bH819 TaxID=1255619 RepID=A0A1X8XKX4_9ENTE|nr:MULTISPECIES: hypothetical protein [Vagococcus]SLM84558.1 hypothetical protein FM121_00600 [Vagococcus fluvialis bH819]HCM89977.1 hypothetical protein [Vagococcus sp.]